MIIGQAKESKIDVNGNLVVDVEYTLTDGSKYTEGLVYSCFSFTKALLLKDIKSKCECLMYKIYNSKQNTILATTDISDVSYQCTSVDWIVSKRGEPLVTIKIDDSDNQNLAQEAVAEAKLK